MNLRIKGALAVASVLMIAAAAKPASAAILLSDEFDGYADQAAFAAAWPPVAGVNSGSLSSARSVSAPNSILFAVTPAVQRNAKTFAESGVATAANPISFSFDFYDADASAAPYRQFSGILDATGTSSGQQINIGLQNTLTSAADGGNYYMARILGYDGGDGSGAFFKLNQGSAPLRSTGWHNLKAVLSPTDITFYVDGILSSTEVTTVQTTRSF